MKRTVALLLAAWMLLSLAACGENPTSETQQFTREQFEQAAAEVAMGYYYKNPYCQYEARELSVQGKWSGLMRNTHGAPPEYASEDQEHFSQCTDFCSDVLAVAYGYERFKKIAPGTVSEIFPIPADDPRIAFRWTPDDPRPIEDALEELKTILRPGDCVSSCYYKNGSSDGHEMFYISDYFGDGKQYLLHCWGKPLDPSSSVGSERREQHEQEGSIKLQTFEELLLAQAPSGAPKWDLRTHNNVGITVFRAIDAADFTNTITPATLSRMFYRGIEIDRRLQGRTQYQDLAEGETVTVEIEVTNNGKNGFASVPVTETLPQGAALSADGISSGGVLDGNTVCWKQDVLAGESVIFSCTYTVTAKRGEEVLFPAGKVADIDTREITVQVGGKHLTEDENTILAKFGADPSAFTYHTDNPTDLGFIEAFYKWILNVDLDLPETFDDYLSARTKLFRIVGMENGMLTPDDDFAQKYPQLLAMEVRKHLGGRQVYLGNDVSNRTLDLKQSLYRPGDIVMQMWYNNEKMVLMPEYYNTCIYLGRNKVLTLNENGDAAIADFDDTIYCLFKSNFFVVLRPTMAFDDIHTGK